MVHSYEELKSVKYSDLLKIAKSLQLKCHKLKKQKVIQEILKNQEMLMCAESINLDEKDGDTEILDDIEFPEHTLLSDDEKIDSPKSAKKDNMQSVAKISTGNRKRSFNSTGDGPPTMVTLRRSNTFIIDRNESKNNVVPLGEENVKSPLTSRNNSIHNSEKQENFVISPTFDAKVTSPSKRRRISDSKATKIIKSPDLTCSEVLTAADIKDVEENSLNPAFNSAKSSFNHKNITARRSLRGYLLNSRLAKRVSSFEAIPSPLIKERHAQNVTLITNQTNDSKVNNECVKSPRTTKDSVVSTVTKRMLSKSCINTPKLEQPKTTNKHNAASSIPRFVAYARKLTIPNFSRIHEKNFQKMEGVDDYLERKQLRARNAQNSYCLSSSKKTRSVFKPTVTSTKDMNINFTEKGTLGNWTPFATKPSIKKTMSKSNVTKLTNSVVLKGSKNAKENCVPAKVKLEFEKSVSLKKGLHSSKPLLKERTRLEIRGVNRFNSSQSEVKNVRANLKKGPKVMTSSERRANNSTFLKGVRLNKRFELQMAKRGLTMK